MNVGCSDQATDQFLSWLFRVSSLDGFDEWDARWMVIRWDWHDGRYFWHFKGYRLFVYYCRHQCFLCTSMDPVHLTQLCNLCSVCQRLWGDVSIQISKLSQEGGSGLLFLVTFVSKYMSILGLPILTDSMIYIPFYWWSVRVWIVAPYLDFIVQGEYI